MWYCITAVLLCSNATQFVRWWGGACSRVLAVASVIPQALVRRPGSHAWLQFLLVVPVRKIIGCVASLFAAPHTFWGVEETVPAGCAASVTSRNVEVQRVWILASIRGSVMEKGCGVQPWGRVRTKGSCQGRGRFAEIASSFPLGVGCVSAPDLCVRPIHPHCSWELCTLTTVVTVCTQLVPRKMKGQVGSSSRC